MGSFSGHKHSEETKAKIRAAKLGRVLSEKERAKRRGWSHTPEAIEKIAAAKRGRPMSDEARAKSSTKQKGRAFTDEHKQKLSESRRKYDIPRERLESWIKAGSDATRGKPFSPQHREKLSAKKRGKVPAYMVNMTPDERVEATAKARRAAGLAHPTSLERDVADFLTSLGVEFLQQHRIGRYLVDFFVPSKNLIVEADGAYWHGTVEAQARDDMRDQILTALGYVVLRLPEAHIKARQFEIVKKGLG